MPIKIFISHQQADAASASSIAERLKYSHQLDSYLDVVDPGSAKAGEDIGEYVRKQLGACTHLLAVVSSVTQGSWWVPWEIGIATEKTFPIATYVEARAVLPDYLKKWPYLRDATDLDKYASAVKQSDQTVLKRGTLIENAGRVEKSENFYRVLRASLGQR